MERPLRPDLPRYASAALQQLRRTQRSIVSESHYAALLIEQGVPEHGEYLTSALGYLQEGKPNDAEKFGRIALELAWEVLKFRSLLISISFCLCASSIATSDAETSTPW